MASLCGGPAVSADVQVEWAVPPAGTKEDAARLLCAKLGQHRALLLAVYSAAQLAGAHHRATPFSQVDGHTVYPSVKVKDAVAEGAAKVKVVLKSVEMCEEDGSAEQTTWAALAFNFSDNGRKR